MACAWVWACGTTPAATTDAGVDGGLVEAGADAAPKTKQTLLVSSTVTADPSGGPLDSNLVFLNAGDPPCPYQEIGACIAWTCAPRTPAAVLVNAGPLTLERSGAELLATLFDPKTGTYPADRKAGSVWSAGESLVFLGAGGPDVPAFQAPLVAPPDITLAPLTVSDAGTTFEMTGVDRNVGLTVSWTAPTTGSVAISVLPSVTVPTPVDGPRVLCRFDAAAGTGTVPPAALSTLGSGTTANALVQSDARTTINVSGYTLLVRAGRARRIDVTFK